MEPVVTVASVHQWDGEMSQREAPGGLVSLAAILPKLTGLKVRWLKSPALESGLRSRFQLCNFEKINKPPWASVSPTVKCVCHEFIGTCGKTGSAVSKALAHSRL